VWGKAGYTGQTGAQRGDGGIHRKGMYSHLLRRRGYSAVYMELVEQS
jgi:hypothetical protein